MQGYHHPDKPLGKILDTVKVKYYFKVQPCKRNSREGFLSTKDDQTVTGSQEQNATLLIQTKKVAIWLHL